MLNNQYDPDYIKDLFNRMSGSYERVNYITSFGFTLRWRKQFLTSFIKSKKNIKFLDLMTGMGETWSYIKYNFPNSELSALDFSEQMLAYAETKNNSKFNNQIKILNQNVLKSNLPREHYDIVVSAFGLKTFNSKQLRILAQETKRILKKGGIFSFIEVSRPDNFILRQLFKIHLKFVVPFCGKLLLGNTKEYRMLWHYTNAYNNSDQAARIFQAAGLTVHKRSYFMGCATGIYGEKP